MIAYLCGSLHDIDVLTGQAIILCGGVGYGVELSQRAVAGLRGKGSQVACPVYTHVAEDQLRLFGFENGEERQAFLALLTTSGVGPRLALAILAELTPHALATAVASKDKRALVRVAGVGSKKAERLLLELDGKFVVGAVGLSRSSTSAAPSRQGDVESALLHLGFAAADASQAAQAAVAAAGERAQTAELVRLALRQLMPSGPTLADGARR